MTELSPNVHAYVPPVGNTGAQGPGTTNITNPEHLAEKNAFYNQFFKLIGRVKVSGVDSIIYFVQNLREYDLHISNDPRFRTKDLDRHGYYHAGTKYNLISEEFRIISLSNTWITQVTIYSNSETTIFLTNRNSTFKVPVEIKAGTYVYDIHIPALELYFEPNDNMIDMYCTKYIRQDLYTWQPNNPIYQIFQCCNKILYLHNREIYDLEHLPQEILDLEELYNEIASKCKILTKACV